MVSKLIAITGGIGAGKSVVSRIVECLGYKVYDCDSRAKMLMDGNSEIKAKLIERISPSVVREDGEIDRTELAKIVFSDSTKLTILNDIVHGAVREDILKWRECTQTCDGIMFVESAILFESKLDKCVDEVWHVAAPIDIRINRVILRNSCSREQVIERINAQKKEERCSHHRQFTIMNDGRTSLLMQINNLLRD